IEWPQLLQALETAQPAGRKWAFNQKQTGADRLTLGGSLAANAHGRGLTLPPMISDVEAIKLLDAHGRLVECSRTENPELFSLAIGGYGLFGVIYSVTLRLVPRRQLERVVEVRMIDRLPALRRLLPVDQRPALLVRRHADVDLPGQLPPHDRPAHRGAQPRHRG